LLVAGRYLNVKKNNMTENYAENIWRSLERRFFQQSLILGLLRLRLMPWLRQFNRFRAGTYDREVISDFYHYRRAMQHSPNLSLDRENSIGSLMTATETPFHIQGGY
jgi:hypothetical protein